MSKFLSFPTSFTAFLGLDYATVLPVHPRESQGMHFPTPLCRTGRRGMGKEKQKPLSHPTLLQISRQTQQEQARQRHSLLPSPAHHPKNCLATRLWAHTALGTTSSLSILSTVAQGEKEQQGWGCLQLPVPSWDCVSWSEKQSCVPRDLSGFPREKPHTATKAQEA